MALQSLHATALQQALLCWRTVQITVCLAARIFTPKLSQQMSVTADIQQSCLPQSTDLLGTVCIALHLRKCLAVLRLSNPANAQQLLLPQSSADLVRDCSGKLQQCRLTTSAVCRRFCRMSKHGVMSQWPLFVHSSRSSFPSWALVMLLSRAQQGVPSLPTAHQPLCKCLYTASFSMYVYMLGHH